MARRYIDVNILVYWLTGHPEYGRKALEWVKRVEAATRGTYITASITIYELIVVLARLTGRKLSDKSLVDKVLEALSGLQGLRVVETTQQDYLDAARYMEAYSLDLEDALHLAVALRHKAAEIVSNDTDFDKTPLKRVF
ncbi:hypothetical protein Pyrde_0848 [Pyrodictium delaneyi]|uniref:Ribonuclease VapC n=1 Tax=Pyrodictium delaneyi TaxID=1273541 RepID=A0A0P0N2M9_9CREN|nr:type II toxin-antitoxin system VapC family toxin [Pyrodictium delaneyi]ALL00898.1 hypothetical protein Pyrde_0848 [Pyrodictium delaneyi]OWJ55482.1 PIN domain nuclease [Pyrodictium delaneyi]